MRMHTILKLFYPFSYYNIVQNCFMISSKETWYTKQNTDSLVEISMTIWLYLEKLFDVHKLNKFYFYIIVYC